MIFVQILSAQISLAQSDVKQPTYTWIVKPEYSNIGYYNEGLCAFEKNELCGFFDENGKIAIAPKYESVADFCEGLAAVLINGKWGFINKMGQFVIQPKFDDAWDFSEGLAAVRIGRQWGAIDKVGTIVIAPQFDNLWNFNNGLAAFESNGKWGFVRKNGTIAIMAQYKRVQNFSEGFATVEAFTEKPTNQNHGVIDTDGIYMYDPVLNHAGYFKEGMARAYITNEKNGFINKYGKWTIVNGILEIAEKFSDGLAYIHCNEDNTYGYIDKSGKIVFQSSEIVGYNFKDGYAAAHNKDGKWGVIDKNFQWVVAPEFTNVLQPQKGFATIQKDIKYGIIKIQK